MRILVACEESQAVCIAFRDLGHEAFSCDILPCSGGHPEWHLIGDIKNYISGFYKCKCGNIHEETTGKYGCCDISKLYLWDMMIAFPPCTHMASSGAKHFSEKRNDGRQQQGIDFFMSLINANIPRVAVENPIGIMSTVYRKPDQIIQPWMFGDEFTKPTCLWLKGLPKLQPTKIVYKGDRHITKSGKSLPAWYNLPPSENRSKIRSKTFPGIAKAMAEQWGNLI